LIRAAKAALPVLIAATVTAGCAEAPEQHDARLAVERTADRAQRSGTTRCTSNPRLFFTEGPTASIFVCTVKVAGGVCDRYLVHRSGREYDVRLRERGGDCILPAA
jgi:hypothetical protein